MNYTEKYHLPQWEETDRIMRTDFNQMCANIDQGIGSAQSTADTAQTNAAAAQTAAQTAQNAAAAAHSAANAAQAAADAAQTSANNAQTTADAAFCPSYMPYAVGSYKGTGCDLTVNVGFRPSFLIIVGMTPAVTEAAAHLLIAGANITNYAVTFSNTGFTLKCESAAQSVTYGGQTYSYIAFR